MDIPLLFESKLQHFVEKILVVSVSEEIQLQRLMARNALVEEEACARIASQLPYAVKEQAQMRLLTITIQLKKRMQQLEYNFTKNGA